MQNHVYMQPSKLIKGSKVEIWFTLFGCIQRLQIIPPRMSCVSNVLTCQPGERVAAEDDLLSPAVPGYAIGKQNSMHKQDRVETCVYTLLQVVK